MRRLEPETRAGTRSPTFNAVLLRMRGQLRAPRVLVVDDDAELCASLRDVLKASGYDTSEAASAESALEMLETRGPFDAVLTDVHMPGQTGLELLALIQAKEPSLAVVLFTGDTRLTTAQSAIHGGAFRYLLKPLRLSDLQRATALATEHTRRARLQNDALETMAGDRHGVGGAALMNMRLTRALKSMSVEFRPIIDVTTGGVFARELLVRSREPELDAREPLVRVADLLGRAAEAGRRIRKLAADALDSLPPRELLVVPLHTAALEDPEIWSSSDPLATRAPRVFYQIDEPDALELAPEARGRMVELRAIGYRFAVGRVRSSYSAIVSTTEAHPHLVIIDASLVHAVERSETKRNVVASLLGAWATDPELLVVADGVRSRQQCETLTGLGCRLMQGDIFESA